MVNAKYLHPEYSPLPYLDIERRERRVGRWTWRPRSGVGCLHLLSWGGGARATDGWGVAWQRVDGPLRRIPGKTRGRRGFSSFPHSSADFFCVQSLNLSIPTHTNIQSLGEYYYAFEQYSIGIHASSRSLSRRHT